jgi:PAS domain S-box-containing protein
MGNTTRITEEVSPRTRGENGSSTGGGVNRSGTVVERPSAVASESDSSALFSCNPAAMYVFASDTLEILEVNQAALTQYGFRREEFLRLRLDEIWPAEEVARLLKALRDSDASGMQKYREWTHTRRAGDRIVVQVAVQRVEFSGRSAVVSVDQDVTARKRVEEEGAARASYLNALTENNPTAIVVFDTGDRVQMCNAAFERMFQYSQQELLGKKIDGMIAAPGLEPETAEFSRRVGSGATVRTTTRRKRRDGAVVDVQLIGLPLIVKGRQIGTFGMYEDVTERKRAEAERQATLEIIRSVNVTEHLDDLLKSIHAALRKVIYAENCFVALYEPATGLFEFPFFADQYDVAPAPQRLERSCTAYVHRTGRGALIPQPVFDELARAGELELVGTPSPSWLGAPLRTPSATIGVIVVQHYQDTKAYTQRDLEFLESVAGQIALAIERKRAETALRESEARLRVLVEQLPAILWTVDSSMRFSSALGAGLTRLGLCPADFVGKTVAEFLQTTDEDSQALSAHRRAVRGEPVTFPMDLRGGSFACHAEPLRGANGQILGAICMALDVSDRKKLEEQLRQAQKMEAVGRLAGGIAHDFNNLLMVIQGHGELLTDRLKPGEPLRRNAEQIQEASQRAASLTRQLLAFSRKQMLAPTVMNMQAVVADMEKILRRLIGEDVELAVVNALDLWSIKADRSQIEQVILNLAVNARDAMPRGGRLTIETSNVEFDNNFARSPIALAPGRYVMLAVTDNGMGMDAETQAHIFEPFFTTKEKGKGTGLGLATVYGIVKQSGGYIWVYSEPDNGTTFKVYLPAVEEAISPKEARPAVKNLPRGTETILLVEDEQGVRELAREYLEICGYTVLVAEDGTAALRLVEKHAGPIHLMMTDVVMPGMNGSDLANRVAALRPEIRVIYMSGYTDQSIVHHGLLAPEMSLLQKPFSLSTLAHKLREALAPPTAQS